MLRLSAVRALLNGSPMSRLATLEMFASGVHSSIAKNVARASVYEQIKHKAEGGKVAVIVWQRDCDCAEWTERRLIDATPKAYDTLLDRVYSGAEGPVRILGVEPPSFEFEPSSRDRVLEAYENGHSWSV